MSATVNKLNNILHRAHPSISFLKKKDALMSYEDVWGKGTFHLASYSLYLLERIIKVLLEQCSLKCYNP